MKALIGCVAIIFALAAVTSADAKGCIKGAVVGGVAGHYAGHHGFLGAAGGCIVGRHEAKKRAQMQKHVTTNLILRLAKMRSTSSAAVTKQRIKRAPPGALFAYRCFGCAIEENGLAYL